MKKSISILSIILAVLLVIPINAQAAQLIPGGELIGLALTDHCVTIAAFDDGQSAAQAAGMQIGDQITHIDDTSIGCAGDIRTALDCSNGSVQIRFLRKGQPQALQIFPRITSEGPRLGIYLKQGITGVGTITYYDPETGSFGALGHSVNDPSGKLLEMTSGTAYHAGILHIKIGKTGTPGQLMGCMHADRTFGTLYKNTPQGVFGKTRETISGTPIPTAQAGQIQTGNAVIRSTVCDGIPQEYSVKILKIYPAGRNGGRNMLIKVTDPKLLETTGGIVQGMSGSPICQDGRIVGAVTHVLVNDPTMGYGIFIENMLEAAG